MQLCRAFICFYSAQFAVQNRLLYLRERLPSLPSTSSSSLPHHLNKFFAPFSFSSYVHYLFYTGQKQPINLFTECRIPWAAATFTNCWRFKTNDGDFSSGALSDLFSSLARWFSVSPGACSYCHSARRNQEKYYKRVHKAVTRSCRLSIANF